MKIAVVDPSLFTWPYDNALVTALRKKGHDAVLYSKYLADGEQGKGDPCLKEVFYKGFEAPFMKSLPSPVFLGLKGLSHVFSLFSLWWIFKHSRPDIIHFQWVPLPVVDRFFIPLFRKIAPVVFTVHDSSPFNNSPKSSLQTIGAIEIMKLFDHLIVHTEKGEICLAKYGLPSHAISRIPHGVLKVYISPKYSEKSKNSEFVTFLLFGHLKPYKGADILIKALSGMNPESLSRTRLHIAGKPQMEMEPLFDLARKSSVDKNIVWDLRFIGEDEIGGIFQSADIVVMPYREIDASGVLMVSLSMGKPIIASKIGLFSELLTDGRDACLVPAEDVDVLTEVLNKMVNNNDFRSKMAKNAKDLGQSIPDWDEIAERTTLLYKKISSVSGCRI